MIDKTKLNTEVRETANLLLADIINMSQTELQDNLRYFAEKAKDVAEGIMERYVFDIVEKYTENELYKINDSAKLGAFVDFSTGYQQRMLQWINEHPLEVKEETFEVPNRPVLSADTKNVKPMAIAGVGTVVAIGLYIYSNVWIALAAELLTLAIAKLYDNKLQRDRRIEQEVKQQQYEIAIEEKKEHLINGLIKELEKWLDQGEEASNELLASFNLKS